MEMQRFTLGALWTNCYLVWGHEKNGIVVDPGGDAEKVKKFMEENGIKLEYVLLTHGHADHILGIEGIRKLAKNGVAVHGADAGLLTDANKNLSHDFGNPFTVGQADKILADGDKFSAGRLSVEVIHTPGHTPGGVCFYITEGDDEILLCGDTLFARSIGRTDLVGGDEQTLINSLRKLERFNGGLRAYPGHGPSTTIGEEIRYNPYWPKQ